MRFYESIEQLKQMGIEQMIEIGPGKVLTGFLKKIDKTIAASRVEDAQTLLTHFQGLIRRNLWN